MWKDIIAERVHSRVGDIELDILKHSFLIFRASRYFPQVYEPTVFGVFHVIAKNATLTSIISRKLRPWYLSLVNRSVTE